MGRGIGDSIFPANFEPRKAAPFDARTVVSTKADLTALATWDTGDGNAYTYKGMLVSVINDGINNGVYRLNADDYSVASNWVLESSPALASTSGFTLTAALDIGGDRAIATSSGNAIYADCSTNKPAVGISTGAVSSGEDVTVQNSGKLTVTGAGWTPNGLIFLSTNGTLTQTEPMSGISQVLGRAYSSDVMIIDIQRPIILT